MRHAAEHVSFKTITRFKIKYVPGWHNSIVDRIQIQKARQTLAARLRTRGRELDRRRWLTVPVLNRFSIDINNSMQANIRIQLANRCRYSVSCISSTKAFFFYKLTFVQIQNFIKDKIKLQRGGVTSHDEIVVKGTCHI